MSRNVEWCRDRKEAPMTRSPSEQGIRGAATGAAQSHRSPQASAPPRYCFDASLLFRCMDMLRIDRRRLAGDDPLLFCELQGICALCRSKEECTQDLAGKFDDVCWDEWWLYCPNSAMLTTIGALQNCNRAALQHDIGRLTSLSHIR